jgi:MerR family transcriptional regulator, copper efflux regulator
VATYLISELAERAGVPATTLRYYEQAGLLPAARSANGYRRYTEDALDRLALIRAGQHLGLPLAQIRALLTARDTSACATVRDQLRPLLSARVTQARAHAATLADSIVRLEQALSATGPDPAPGPCHLTCGCLTDPVPHPGIGSVSDNSKKYPGGHQPIACTLDGDGQEARLAEWRGLFARAAARETVPGGVRVTLPAALAGPAAELAAAEQGCCPFFRFTLVFDGGEVHLTVQAPADAGSLLAALTDETGPSASLYTV